MEKQVVINYILFYLVKSRCKMKNISVLIKFHDIYYRRIKFKVIK